MRARTYLKRLLAIWGAILAAAAGYVAYFVAHYPPPLTDHISFDAKLSFVRDRIDPDRVDTVIIGSSIGLNDLLGSVMEKESVNIKKAVNMSVYGATTLQAEQLMMLTDTFPNLKRVIYSVQYSDTPHDWRFKDYDPQALVKYMRHELSLPAYLYMMFKACRNLPFCYQRQQKFASEHLRNNKFESLIFDGSGSVPLHIYGKDIIGHRWRIPHPGIMANVSFQAMARMAQKAQKKGIHYYIVHQPYRKGLYDTKPKVRGAMAYFDTYAQKAITPYEGVLIRVQPLNLGDRYFSDRTHLNDQGSPIVSRYVAKQIDIIENKKGER